MKYLLGYNPKEENQQAHRYTNQHLYCRSSAEIITVPEPKKCSGANGSLERIDPVHRIDRDTTETHDTQPPSPRDSGEPHHEQDKGGHIRTEVFVEFWHRTGLAVREPMAKGFLAEFLEVLLTAVLEIVIK